MSEQNSDRRGYNTWQRLDRQSKFYKTYIFKQSVNNGWIKIHYNLSRHLKILKTTQFFRRKLKSFLLQETFFL
jgi:hypothetical protein